MICEKKHQLCSNSSKVSSKKKTSRLFVAPVGGFRPRSFEKNRQGVERQAGSGGGKEAIGTSAEKDRNGIFIPI